MGIRHILRRLEEGELIVAGLGVVGAELGAVAALVAHFIHVQDLVAAVGHGDGHIGPVGAGIHAVFAHGMALQAALALTAGIFAHDEGALLGDGIGLGHIGLGGDLIGVSRADDFLGKTGGIGNALAMLGVIACPITSGDTAFRSARLVLADWFKIDQKKWQNRLMLCVPVLGVGAILGIGNALGKIDYTVIWRYFSWTNQTLAMIVLWAASMYLFYDKKNYWITAVPATFMSAVSVTYFLLGNECLGQFLNTKTADGATVYNTAVAYPVGVIVAVLFLGIFLYTIKKRNPQPHYETLHK